ncbi:MAG TPA: hypothetical protein VNA28_04580 [Solirubrobacteraceae bacterium]|nr:hypothetical protein [Solirubrobacteraceae bacterium]
MRRLRPRSTSLARTESSSQWCSARAMSGSSFVAQSLTRWNFGDTDSTRRIQAVFGLPADSATALSTPARSSPGAAENNARVAAAGALR